MRDLSTFYLCIFSILVIFSLKIQSLVIQNRIEGLSTTTPPTFICVVLCLFYSDRIVKNTNRKCDKDGMCICLSFSRSISSPEAPLARIWLMTLSIPNDFLPAGSRHEMGGVLNDINGLRYKHCLQLWILYFGGRRDFLTILGLEEALIGMLIDRWWWIFKYSHGWQKVHFDACC